MKIRNGATDAYTTRHTDFIGDILVKCPHCHRKAVVKTSGYPQQDWDRYEEDVCFGCHHCGTAKRLDTLPKQILFVTAKGKSVCARVLHGENSRTDPFFGLELWLVKPCLKDAIWAYNEAHLQFLEEFIAASLRSRPDQAGYIYHHSIGSRLPRWMTSAKNRDQVLRVIRSLKSCEI